MSLFSNYCPQCLALIDSTALFHSCLPMDAAPIENAAADPQGAQITCGRGCACLTECGDYYALHGLPAPEPMGLDAGFRKVIAAERERCANLCREIALRCMPQPGKPLGLRESSYMEAANDCASAILNERVAFGPDFRAAFAAAFSETTPVASSPEQNPRD